ncbi:protein of unknown function [Streptomyces sp. KY75]|nr:protein of unknown function [Streptomyces sp. KY70]CAD5991351.1 protein of unknown function [Streptomyces sp. KY75]
MHNDLRRMPGRRLPPDCTPPDLRQALRRRARAPYGVLGRARPAPADESGTHSETPHPGSSHGLRQPA